MKFLFSIFVIGFLATSCNNASQDSNSDVDTSTVAPLPSGADTTVTGQLTRTDSTQMADTLKK